MSLYIKGPFLKAKKQIQCRDIQLVYKHRLGLIEQYFCFINVLSEFSLNL